MNTKTTNINRLDTVPDLTVETTARDRLIKTVRLLNVPQGFQFFQVFQERLQDINHKHAAIRCEMSQCSRSAIAAAMAIHVLSTTQKEDTDPTPPPYLQRIEHGEL